MKEFGGDEIWSPPKITKVAKETRPAKRRKCETSKTVAEEEQSRASLVMWTMGQQISVCFYFFCGMMVCGYVWEMLLLFKG